MNIVLLSGGSGQRLWPLSNEIRSKQFIKIFHKEDGELESMVQRVYRQIRTVDTDATVTIATSKSQVSAIHNQLGENVGISVEPCRRDTFPAIALAAAYLKDVQHIGEEEAVVICPVDPYVEDDYFKTIEALGNRAAESEANLVLMGIEPTYPSEKYGYIIPKSKENISEVSMFKEKPTAEVAEGYISQGALWNGGVFAFRLGYVLKRAHELIDFKNYDDLFAKYNTLKKISFDYAVVEHEPLIEVMRFSGTWKDLGTWNTLTEAMDSNNVGEALFNEKCENVHVVNELNIAHAYFIENIIMFIPFGLLAPMVFERMRKVRFCVFIGFLCSCGIELSQLITQRGYCQLDDVVTNTVGMLVGWGIWKMLSSVGIAGNPLF